jgi:hypothetical protein
MRLYVNGTQVNSQASSRYSANASPWRSRSARNTGYPARGTASFPGGSTTSVYNKVLSATQVQLHDDSGRQ